MPMMRARRMCPQAVVVQPDFDALRARVGRRHGGLPLGDAAGRADLARRGVPRRARRRPAPRRRPRRSASASGPPIEDEQGITCSVGVATTKFVAKLASARCKPDGLLVVPAEEVVAFLHPLPVGALWGVGEKTEEVLRRLGLHTVGDLAAHPGRARCTRALGPAAGAHLSALAWGRDERVVVPHEPDKSIGAENTFATDVDDPAVIARELLRLSERTAARLRAVRPGRPHRRRSRSASPTSPPSPGPGRCPSRPTSAAPSTTRRSGCTRRSGWSAPASAWSASGSRASPRRAASRTSCSSASASTAGATPSRPSTGRPGGSAPGRSVRPPSSTRPDRTSPGRCPTRRGGHSDGHAARCDRVEDGADSTGLTSRRDVRALPLVSFCPEGRTAAPSTAAKQPGRERRAAL